MSPQITVTLPDGTSRECEQGTTAADIAASIGKRLAKDALAAIADGEWVDLDRPLNADTNLVIVTPGSDHGREVLRHSTAHVLAQAVVKLFPGAKYAIGPAINDGFYYDFALPNGGTFTESDLDRITAEMQSIVKANQSFVRSEYDFDAGLAVFADQEYKREIIEKVRGGAADGDDTGEVAGDAVSVYRNVDANGDATFTDYDPTIATWVITLRNGLTEFISETKGKQRWRNVTVEENIGRLNYRKDDYRDYLDGDLESSIYYNNQKRKDDINSGKRDPKQVMYQNQFENKDLDNQDIAYGSSGAPVTLISDKSRVYKGGSWADRAYWLSSGNRRFLDEDKSSDMIGFRCAMDRIGSPKGNR